MSNTPPPSGISVSAKSDLPNSIRCSTPAVRAFLRAASIAALLMSVAMILLPSLFFVRLFAPARSFSPYPGVKSLEVHEAEIFPQDSCRPVQSHKRCLNGKRAASAHGIDKGAFIVPSRCHDKSGSQCLL